MRLWSDNLLAAGMRTRDHSLCRTCQMAPTAKLLKGPPVWGAGRTRSCRVCVTLAFAVVRHCGRDSMPIQPPRFGLLWKWPKHSERNPSNRKGKPSLVASRRVAVRNVSFGTAPITKLKSSILARSCFREIATNIFIAVHSCRALSVTCRRKYLATGLTGNEIGIVSLRCLFVTVYDRNNLIRKVFIVAELLETRVYK